MTGATDEDAAPEGVSEATERATRINTSREAFESMLEALDRPPRPLSRLRQAARRYKEADEVVIEKRGDALILRPKPRSWGDYFKGSAQTLPEDFPDSLEDEVPQDR